MIDVTVDHYPIIGGPTAGRIRRRPSTRPLCALPEIGLEPTCFSAPDPKSDVSTNFTIQAVIKEMGTRGPLEGGGVKAFFLIEI